MRVRATALSLLVPPLVACAGGAATRPIAEHAAPKTDIFDSPVSASGTVAPRAVPEATSPSADGGVAHAEDVEPRAWREPPGPPPEPGCLWDDPRNFMLGDGFPSGGWLCAARPDVVPPFDHGAADSFLGSIDVQSCKSAKGPTGSGHVRVTFQPSGTVSKVEVVAPPFSGTGVGRCVAGKFRSASVPAFSGRPVTVRQSFTIN